MLDGPAYQDANHVDQPLILLVEDDARLRELTERFLQSQAFRVRAVANLLGMHAQLKSVHVDLIVLDLMLPDGDGLHACRDLRATGNATPIIVLTARGDEIDRIIGLEFGADDYLPKPCNPRELSARIKAVLRRTGFGAASLAPAETEHIVFGDNTLDPAARSLQRGGEFTRLTSGEFAVLWALVSRPNRPLSRDQLMNLAFGKDHQANDRSVDVMISRLRRLVETDLRAPRWIQTVWGSGYVFVPNRERS
jgi:two-component system, OmpR family, phosphate regulon response regulator OmpR